jgi:uncharacterized membrane protein
MLFFALIAIITLLAKLVLSFAAPTAADWRNAMRLGLAAALIFTGIDHLITPQRYLPMMPSFVPWPAEIVAFTGVCEIAGAVGLFIPRLRTLAGIMLAVYFVCVFPANIRNAIEGLSVDGLPGAGWYYWARLAFQPLVIWWTLYASAVIGWPFRGRAHETSSRPALS